MQLGALTGAENFHTSSLGFQLCRELNAAFPLGHSRCMEPIDPMCQGM